MKVHRFSIQILTWIVFFNLYQFKVHITHAKHYCANISHYINRHISEIAQKQLFWGPKIEIMDFKGKMGYFVNFNFMAQKIHNLSSF